MSEYDFASKRTWMASTYQYRLALESRISWNVHKIISNRLEIPVTLEVDEVRRSIKQSIKEEVTDE